jgi:hypothetical protein
MSDFQRMEPAKEQKQQKTYTEFDKKEKNLFDLIMER